MYRDDSLPGFGVRVSQGGAKTFCVMYGRTRKLKVLGRFPDVTLKDARREAQLLMATHSEQPASRKITYDEARERYLREKKIKLRPTTYKEYVSFFRRIDFGGDVTDVTPSNVARQLSQFSDRPITQNKAHSILKTFFKWCEEHEFCDRNPVRGGMPHRSRSRDRILADDEIRAVWGATDYQPFGTFVRVLLLTGQRRTETSQLKPENVGDTLIFRETKNNTVHEIPLCPTARRELEKLPPDLFGGLSGYSKYKRRLDAQLGLPNWTLHDLRRTFSSTMARLGTPIHITEKLLNHKSGSLSGVVGIYNRYSYLDEMRAALETYEGHIANLVGE
jgi:integrase